MNWADVISNAIEIFLKRENYAYFYGAKGQVLTDTIMAGLIACEKGYFSQYSNKELREIIEWSRNKVGIDCSAFINLCTGQVNWSTGYYTESLNKTTPRLGTWGNVLYTTHGGKGRHVGLDIGEGKFLHAPKEMHTVEMGLISQYDWEGSGQIKGVSYLFAGNK